MFSIIHYTPNRSQMSEISPNFRQILKFCCLQYRCLKDKIEMVYLIKRDCHHVWISQKYSEIRYYHVVFPPSLAVVLPNLEVNSVVV